MRPLVREFLKILLLTALIFGGIVLLGTLSAWLMGMKI